MYFYGTIHKTYTCNAMCNAWMAHIKKSSDELWIHQPTMQKWLIGLVDIKLHNGSCIYMLDENQWS